MALYSQVIINRCKELARFALMHCIASSLCFWIWTILRETLESLNSYAKYDDYSADDDDTSEEADLLENSVALPLTMNQQSKIRSILAGVSDTCLNHSLLRPNEIKKYESISDVCNSEEAKFGGLMARKLNTEEFHNSYFNTVSSHSANKNKFPPFMSLHGLLLCWPKPAIRPYLDTIESSPRSYTVSPEVASMSSSPK
jgi:hypothetical protein